MTATPAPATTTAPAAPRLALRPVEPGDAGFLHALRLSARAAEIAAWPLPAAAREPIADLQARAQEQHYRQAYPGADDRVVLLDGAPAGRLIVDRSGAAIRLVDVALAPEHRGRGVGTALLRDLLAEAARDGRPVRLSVLASGRARSLYARLGFEPLGESGPSIDLQWTPRA